MPTAKVGKGYAPRERTAPGVAGEKHAVAVIVPGDDEGRVGAARRTEHPLAVASDRQPARHGRQVAQRQAGNLDGIGQRHVFQQVHGDAVSLVFEAAVAMSMPCDVQPAITNRLCGRAEQCTAVLVAHIEGFATGVGNRVVGPGRELVFPAVLGPGVAAALRRYLEAELRIGDHVDPGRGCVGIRFQQRHVLAAILVETAQPVEALKVLGNLGGRRLCDS